MENITKQRLFVDMDGTLAVFTPVDTLETLYQPGYFRDLAPHPKVVQAVKSIVQEHPEVEVNILSAYLGDSRHALAEKNAWLDEHLPEIPQANRIFLPCGENKAAAIKDGVKETDYLLDDYTHNLTLWEPPGRGVKLLNGINHTNGTWQHDCIRYDNQPKMLADKIMNVMKGERIMEERPQDMRNPVQPFTPEQQKQVADAKLLIPDDAVIDIIADPRHTPRQMEALIVTACSHPRAVVEEWEVSSQERDQIGREIFEAVREQAQSYARGSVLDKMEQAQAQLNEGGMPEIDLGRSSLGLEQ